MANIEATPLEKKVLRFFFPALIAFMGGFIFLFGSIPEDIKWYNIEKNGVPVQAEILDLSKVPKVHGRSTTYVTLPYVQFTYNDKQYQGRLNTNRPEWQVGDTIEIYALRSDPRQFMGEPDHRVELYAVGVLMLAAGAALIYICLRKIENEDGLKPSELFRELIKRE